MSSHDLPPLVPVPVLTSRATIALERVSRTATSTLLLGRTLFVLLYADAVEGSGRWIRPAAVVRMGEAQAGDDDERSRLAWGAAPPGADDRPAWYAENTRESVRAALRSLHAAGAVVERAGLAETSAVPRWALARGFAELLACESDALPAAVRAWAAGRTAPEDPARERLRLILGRGAAAARRYLATTVSPEPLDRALAAAAAAAEDACARLADTSLRAGTATANP